MLLRVSTQAGGKNGDLSAVVGGDANSSEVAHAEELTAFAEALIQKDDKTLTKARNQLEAKVGPEAVMDSAAVIGNFERMVRIADASGIPLDDNLSFFTESIRRELELNRFGSANNTAPAGVLKRTARRFIAPLVFRVSMMLFQRRQNKK